MPPKKNPSASGSKSSPSRAASTRIRTTTTPSPDTPIVAKKGRTTQATTKAVEGNTVAGTRTSARHAKDGNPTTETEVALTEGSARKRGDVRNTDTAITSATKRGGNTLNADPADTSNERSLPTRARAKKGDLVETERISDTANESSATSTKTRSRANSNVISHPRGRPRVLPRVLEEVVDIVDSPIAAAASTLAYKLAYGDSDDCSESGTDRQDNEIDSDNESEFSVAKGLVFSDDEEILLDNVLDDDLFRSSFPKNNLVSKYYLEGRPQPPDLSQYPEEEHNDVWAAFKKKRKAYNNKQCYTKAKIAHNNPNCNESRYTGCNSDQLRPMSEVEAGPLLVNHTFSSKDILHLRIAEEAKLQGIVIRVT